MSIPWANGALLSYLASANPYSSNVRLVGKILQSNVTAGQSIVEACDGKQVVIHSQNAYPTGSMICVSGRVLADGSIEEISFYNVEDNFDLLLMNEMIIYAQKYPALFSSQ